MVLASRSRLHAVRVWTNSKGIFHVGWIHTMLNIPSTLDMIRRHIESIPEPGSKSQRIFSGLRFRRESAQLKAELDRVYDGLVSSAHLPQLILVSSFFQLDKHHPRSSASRHESILEVVSLSTQAAGIALDLPVLNVLKSLVGMAALICHTAKVIIIQLSSEHELILSRL
jgi:hypothetical protein